MLPCQYSIKQYSQYQLQFLQMQEDRVVTQQHRTPILTIPQSHFSNHIAHRLAYEAQFFKHELAQALHINSRLLHHSKYFSTLPRVKLEESYPIIQGKPEPEMPSVLVKQEEEAGLPQTKGNCFNQSPDKKDGKKVEKEGEASANSNDKNETKNIPKNYGKAMLAFIQKNYTRFQDSLLPILQEHGLSLQDLLEAVKRYKKQVNSINDLKMIWGHDDPKNPIFKCIRTLAYLFMRKHCLKYIFNSRVKNYSNHIKYLKRIMEGIQNSEDFTSIKQF